MALSIAMSTCSVKNSSPCTYSTKPSNNMVHLKIIIVSIMRVSAEELVNTHNRGDSLLNRSVAVDAHVGCVGKQAIVKKRRAPRKCPVNLVWDQEMLNWSCLVGTFMVSGAVHQTIRESRTVSYQVNTSGSKESSLFDLRVISPSLHNVRLVRCKVWVWLSILTQMAESVMQSPTPVGAVFYYNSWRNASSS